MTLLNSLNEAQTRAWREHMVAALTELRDGQVSFVEGVRRVLAIANESHERDREFDLFAAIDSETDHLPPTRARTACSPEWLAKCDEEAKQVQQSCQARVSALIEKLLTKYSLSPNEKS
jgi:hypothetical protein